MEKLVSKLKSDLKSDKNVFLLHINRMNMGGMMLIPKTISPSAELLEEYIPMLYKISLEILKQTKKHEEKLSNTIWAVHPNLLLSVYSKLDEENRIRILIDPVLPKSYISKSTKESIKKLEQKISEDLGG